MVAGEGSLAVGQQRTPVGPRDLVEVADELGFF